MKKLIMIVLLGLVGLGMSPKAEAWQLWWTWHYSFYGDHATKTLLDGRMIAGYHSPGGNCQTIHTLNGGLVFDDIGPFCSTLKQGTYEVQLCGPGDPVGNCITVKRFTKYAVWQSFCPSCDDMFNTNCGGPLDIKDYPVGVLNVPCFDN